MSYEHLRVERHGPVGWLINNRPDQLNAMNARMRDEFAWAWEELDREAFRGFPGTTPRPPPARRVATLDEPPPRAANGRRTITIQGRGAERNLPVAPRRPTVPRHERPGFKPERAAMWAVFLGLLLILVAATSAHAAVL